MKQAFRILSVVALTGAFLGCSIRQQTVTPPRVVTTEASFDEGRQDSGLKSVSLPVDGKEEAAFIVSGHWLERYDAMLLKYGDRFLPPVKAGDRRGIKALEHNRFSVSPEVSVRFTRMNTWRKNE